MSKSKYIQYSVTEDDYEILEKVVAKERTSMAEFSRRCTLPTAEKKLEEFEQ